MAQEKRKHVRVEHRGTVHFVTANRSIQGSSINISRNGMQVVVNLPHSHESIRSISFQLPASRQSIRVPCRLVRTERSGVAEEQTLGVEFLHDAQTQLLLIERFVQDSASGGVDSRQLPRTSCRISNVKADVEGVRVLSVDNLSTDGLLFSFTGTLSSGDSLTLVLTPSDDPRPLCLRGNVVYVVENAFRDALTAGMRLKGLRETEERRLRNLIVGLSSGNAARDVYDCLDGRATQTGFHIGDATAIIALLAELSARRVPLSMLLEDTPTIRECALAEVREEDGTLVVQTSEALQDPSVLSGRSAHIGFSSGGGSHYFRTRVVNVESERLVFELPASVMRSDKRSYGRKPLGVGSAVRLLVDHAGSDHEVEGRLVDVSRRGFLCEIEASLASALRHGDQVRYSLDANLGLDSHGQIRHTRRVSTPEGSVLRVGIEAGIARSRVPARRIDPEAWARDRPFQSGRAESPTDPLESTVVSYRDRSGREMRALLNATELPVRAPVVVIPPSYGKTKESYAPLVATLLANFRRLGKPLVTLRYDGVNRPGESHNDVPNPRPGYEMLSYRISQGLEDLEATVAFVSGNSHFQSDGVILLTFSMAALDARRYLSTRGEGGVDLWISCMGVPSAQATLRSILGGIDVIGNRRLGIPNGIMGLLGHLVNTDTLAQDALDSKYAYLTDARADMARIAAPVLWIYGRHDGWVDPEEVRDLMTVKTRGRREILEIPSGHNLRTSDDAIQTFKIITAELFLHLHGARIQPCDPCKPQMLRLIAAERERLQVRTLPFMQEYWRGYLIGNERNPVGYDFYANLEEFRAFLADELRLLSLGERETVADLGCGTGLFMEALLEALAGRPDTRPEYRICAVDLVPEALEKTGGKYERVLSRYPHLNGVRLSCHQADLEPSRILPLSRLLLSSRGDWTCLRGKVQGLPGDTCDRLLQRRTPDLDALLAGDRPMPALVARVAKVLDPADVKVVLELNRAARFVLGHLEDRDLKAPGRATSMGQLRASDLVFDVLQLGDSPASAPTLVPEGPYTAIVASLFISYLFNPEYLIEDCHNALVPGGRLLLSSMKPDSDISMIFTNYMRSLQSPEVQGPPRVDGTRDMTGALAMLNEAATLFELEEGGHFRFYTDQELATLLRQAGFVDVEVHPSLGDPSQAWIATGRRAV